jgi:peroxiredoxin (alkyl hydroperoxide reductase subunit C)
MEERSMPGLGERFPEMTVKTTHGMKKLPDDFAGKWFVLFSHPGDFTPVCTTEFVAFQKRIEKFKDMKCELIGHSIDQVYAHLKWEEWIKEKLNVEISFPIIADSLGDVAKKLGMIHSGKGSNSVRAVFIVDAEGLVRIMLYYPQEIGRNMDEIVRAVRALQTADKHRVAIPANWPENEIIGDKVIVPPAADVQSIKDRLAKDKSGEIECLDWWLCYKSL